MIKILNYSKYFLEEEPRKWLSLFKTHRFLNIITQFKGLEN